MRGRVEALLQREQLCEEREVKLAEALRLQDARLRQVEMLAESLGLSRAALEMGARAPGEWAGAH